MASYTITPTGGVLRGGWAPTVDAQVYALMIGPGSDSGFVVLGGHFRTGRVVRFRGRPHNDLLLTILHGFGIMDASFGLARHCTGPLSELVR